MLHRPQRPRRAAVVAGTGDSGQQLGQVVVVEPGGVDAGEQTGAAGVGVGGLTLQRGEEGGDEGLLAGQARGVQRDVKLAQRLVQGSGERAVAVRGEPAVSLCAARFGPMKSAFYKRAAARGRDLARSAGRRSASTRRILPRGHREPRRHSPVRKAVTSHLPSRFAQIAR